MKTKPYPIFFTLLAMLVGYSLMFQFTRNTVWEVELNVETGGILKWYIDTGNGFSEREGGYKSFPPGVWNTVEVLLPTGSPRKIRLDPVDRESRIVLGKIRWKEPWPGGSGVMNLDEATWENVSVQESDGSGKMTLEPIPETYDVFGVWPEVPTHSLLWWRMIRLPVTLFFGVIAFVGGTVWNKRVLREMEAVIQEEDSSPPYVV